MRITHPSAMPAIQPNQTPKAGAGGVGAGGFAAQLSVPGRLGATVFSQSVPVAGQGLATQSAHVLGGVAGLMALQGVEGRGSPRKAAAVKAGSGVLDRLEALKAQILEGRITPATRQAVMDSLLSLDAAEHEAASDLDPGLKDVLAEIRLRAEVELAKLARRMGAPGR